MAARKFFPVLIFIFLSACGVSRTEMTKRIVLLAPFEGRYREIGYNALYAARLAMNDFGNIDIELLAVDDGGTIESAADRARAIMQDSQIKLTIALGYFATDAQVQQALNDVPLLIVGDWSAKPERDSVFMLSNPEISEFISVEPRLDIITASGIDSPMIGSEIFSLKQLSELQNSLDKITIVSSASLPEKGFTERYLSSAEFAPEPGLLATLTYDATAMAVQAAQAANPLQAIQDTTYAGLNGTIRFEGNYWANAPIHYYGYNPNRQLIEIEAASS